MLDKVYCFLKTMVWFNLGLFFGRFIYEYLMYKRYPKLYEISGKMWYDNCVYYGGLTFIFIVILIIIILIIKFKIQNNSK